MVTAIVLAGGTGTRVGAGVPKQFVEVMGKPILAYTLDIFQENRNIDSIEIVCHKDWIDEANRIVREYGIDKTRWVCEGGDTFQDSVLNGVMNLEGKLADDDIVVITFGAAPMTPQEDIDDSIRVCRLHGNGIASADISLCTCIKDDEGSSTQNNIHSLYTVRDRLGGTYICNCDNYFEENPFSPYEYNSFHATVCKEDASDELVVRKNESGRILEVFSCAKSGECIYGHAFMDAAFASRFVRFMEEEEHDFRISQMFWEEFVSRHVDDLDMYVHEYPADMVYEFDHIQEIQNIEGLFLGNVSGRINGIICKVLECTEEEISDINVLEKGLSNILFTFVVRGERYIFRYPGDSTAFFIYRKNECVAQKLGAISHADDTYVYIDEEGNKISKFRENVKDIHGVYYEDVELMRRVARKIRAFHDAGRGMEDWEQYDYDPIYQTERLFKEASKMKGDLFKVFEKEWAMMRKLQRYADMDGVEHTMCHNDINIDNVLLTDDTLDIIDWEFAGYNDPGYDFGRVIAGLEYSADEPKILDILEAYFGRPATEMEHLHWMAYTAIHNWYYVGWALYKESINEFSRDWMLFFFKQTKKLAGWCLPRYEAKYGEID